MFIYDKRLEPLGLDLTKPAWVRYKLKVYVRTSAGLLLSLIGICQLGSLVWRKKTQWLFLIGIGKIMNNDAPTDSARLYFMHSSSAVPHNKTADK